MALAFGRDSGELLYERHYLLIDLIHHLRHLLKHLLIGGHSEVFGGYVVFEAYLRYPSCRVGEDCVDPTFEDLRVVLSAENILLCVVNLLLGWYLVFRGVNVYLHAI